MAEEDFHKRFLVIYIQKVVKVGDELLNVPVRTFRQVSQFGPYTTMEKECMSQPPNSRSYPPGTRDEYMKELEKYFGEEYVKKLIKNNGWKLD